MKPIPIAIGAAAAGVVVAAIVAFLLLGGDSEPMDAVATPSATQPAGPGTDLGQSAAEAVTADGAEEGHVAGPGQGIITVGPGGGVAVETDIGLVTGLRGMRWQDGDLNQMESLVTSDFEKLEQETPDTAKGLAVLPWLSDGILPEEQVAVALIVEMAGGYPALAREVVDLPWLTDDVTENEVIALSQIAHIAEEDKSVATGLIESAEIVAGVNDDSLFAITLVLDVARDDNELAKRIVESGITKGGITGEELAQVTGSSNYYMERIEEEHQELADALKGHTWIAANRGSGGTFLASPLGVDGLTSYERRALSHFLNISLEDKDIAEKIARLSWVADRITEEEQWALGSIRYIATQDSDLARRLIEFPWVADGIERHEMRSLGTIGILMLSWERWGHDGGAFANALWDAPWFQDDLTKGEAAVVTILRATMCSRVLFAYYDLIADPQVRSEVISLPWGEMETIAVRRKGVLFPGDRGDIPDSVFENLRTGIETIGEFMEPPWVTEDVVVYLEPELSYYHGSARGFNFGGDGVAVKVEPGTPEFPEVLYHELAHYYTIRGHFSHWLGEGTANFLASYTMHLSEGVSLQDRYTLAQTVIASQCQPSGLTRIRRTLVRSVGSYLEYRCSYPLGEAFLLAMHNALGREPVVSSLRELYQVGASHSSPLTEGQVYQILLSNVPGPQQDEFRQLYLSHHGGPAGYSADIDVAANPDGAALAALYQSTKGTLWKQRRNWLTEKPFTEWDGVSSDSRDPEGRVSWLYLPEHGLDGPIPPELGNLVNLETLELSGNQLSGPLPLEIVNLANLRRLSLNANQLSGPIPPELGNLVNLETLELFGNQLSGPLPLEIVNLANLRSLSLGANQLSGPIPPELGNLTALEGLGLSNNVLTGEIPAELANLTRLRGLSLSGNQLTGCVPSGLIRLMTRREFTALGLPACGEEAVPPPAAGDTEGDQAALMAFYHAAGGPNWTYPEANPNVHWNPDNPLDSWHGIELDGFGRVRQIGLYKVEGVAGQLPPEIGSLTGLQVFSSENGGLSGPLPPEVGNLVNLEILDLSGNQLSGPLPPEIGNLVNLETLDLSGSQLSGPLPPEVGNLASLELLYLNNNQLSGPLPPEIGNLVSLKVLQLGGNPFSGEIPSEFANLTNLEMFWLRGHELTGCIPGDFPRSVVQYVDVLVPCLDEGLAQGGDAALLLAIHNSLPGGIELAKDLPVTEWAGVTFNEEGRIVELQLSISSEIDKNVPIPREVAQFTELEQLKILGGFTGQIPSEIGSLTKLEELWIGLFTKLTGPLPPALGRLTNLTRLTLSNNQFGSQLPPEIGNLTSLEVFYGNNTGLTGPLPPELGNLGNLESLDLSDNQLSGPLPPELGNLGNLESLDLSDNQLSGPLPPELGNLASLEYLRLRDNQLTGPIPPELGELESLEELHLDGNELTGCIPSPLANNRALRKYTCRDGQ